MVHIANRCQNVYIHNKIYWFGQIYAQALLNSDVVTFGIFICFYILSWFFRWYFFYSFVGGHILSLPLTCTHTHGGYIFDQNFSFNVITIIFLFRKKIHSFNIFLDSSFVFLIGKQKKQDSIFYCFPQFIYFLSLFLCFNIFFLRNVFIA